MGLENVVFAVVAIAVFGTFFYNLRRTWMRLHATARGPEEDRATGAAGRMTSMLIASLGQGKMFRDLKAGIMHAVIFWGFVTVSLGTLEALIQGVFPAFSYHWFLPAPLWSAYLWSQDWANTLVCVAIIYALWRRIFAPPPRLQSLDWASKKDAYIVLTLIFMLVFTSLLVLGGSPHGAHLLIAPHVANAFAAPLGIATSTLAGVVWWLHVAVLFAFTSYLPFSKHQHLIWVWLNMFFRSAKPSGRIRPMEFDENAESFGVGQAAEFTWKQALDGMTCVECGRCTAQCPANLTGKKLDPRAIVHHIKDAVANPERNLHEEIVSHEELWDCTTCGACMEACPLSIEHIPAIIDMRRYLAMTLGEVPTELQTTLNNLETQSRGCKAEYMVKSRTRPEGA